MGKKITIIIVMLCLVGIVGAAVGLFIFPFEPTNPPTADDSGSTEQGIQEVVDANNKFAFDLYLKYKDDPEYKNSNIFFSPYSISTALAMTYEGAKGQTAEEMQSVFHFPENDVLRPNSAAIYNNINKKDKDYQLSTGNALWVQKDYPFLEDYLETVENYYGGKAANVDFVKETEKTRQTINSFIEEQTNDKIKELIPKGILNNMVRMVLTNAIYFKGTWEWEFDKSDTRDGDFKINSGNTVKAEMMHMDPDKARFNYADLDKLQILELPYKGGDISMLILLPKQGEEYEHETGEVVSHDYTLEDIELSSEKLDEYRSSMRETKLDSISIPKFEFDTKYFMKNDLINMGMPTPFSMYADFSGMDGTPLLYIENVIHQAYVKVDEKGTEAAAATAVVMSLKASMNENIFRADHPFVFVIQEKETGNILFLGKITDPTK